MPTPPASGLRRGCLPVIGRLRRTRRQGAVRLVAIVTLTLAVTVFKTAVVTGAPHPRETTFGRRSRLSMSDTLLSLPESDFRLLF